MMINVDLKVQVKSMDDAIELIAKINKCCYTELKSVDVYDSNQYRRLYNYYPYRSTYDVNHSEDSNEDKNDD